MSQEDFDERQYQTALEGIQRHCSNSEAEQEERFLLMAYGNALAVSQGWALRGMDAIDFALMKQFGWSPLVLRELSDREKGLALHEALKGLSLDTPAETVWRENYWRGSHMETPSLVGLWYPNGEWPSK